MTLALLGACGPKYRREVIVPPALPTPIDGLNTEWDDYNAARPPGLDYILFSTNRGSHGGNLDVYAASLKWGPQPRVLAAPAPYAPALMSAADERGPLLMSLADVVEPGASGNVLVFASARPGGAGGLDLYWGEIEPPVVHKLEHLSSTANDVYVTYKFGEVMRPHALFASDRAGTGYDIYEAIWDSYQIGGSPLSVTKLDALSSSADDSAPFVTAGYGATDVVFASKREGGRGGWDIWCSHYDGSTYSPPVAVEIANSEHDEFRPSLAGSILVFSSNRPGGRGGYDLYAVKFDRCGRAPTH